MSELAFPKPTRTLPAERQRVRALSRRDSAKDRATADRLCGELVKRLAGNKCEAAGLFGLACSRTLDWSHGIVRKALPTRWAHSNTFCICRVHHDEFGKSKERWDGWRAMVLGVPLFVRVGEQARAVEPVDVPAVIEGLRLGVFLQGERA